MRQRYLIFLFVFIASLHVYGAQKSHASDGIIELNNTGNSTIKCFAASIGLNRSRDYRLLISCRNLIYPIGDNNEFYILWSVPIGENKNPIRLGDLGLGKKEFTINASFSALLVTKEKSNFPREPSGEIVTQGNVQPLSFLELDPTPTLQPTMTSTQLPKIVTRAPKITAPPQITLRPSKQPAIQQSQEKKELSILDIIPTIIIVIIIIIIVTTVIYLLRKIIQSKN